jgi:hypothetical protein
MKTMSLTEFQRLGYLQEVNRRFLHPLGLALAIPMRKDGFGDYIADYQSDGTCDVTILDAREDPEGFVFADLTDPDYEERARFIDEQWRARIPERTRVFGSELFLTVQPIGTKVEL